MTFPTELERLLKQATPAPWYYAGCNTVHGSDHEEVAHPYNMRGDAKLIILLRNHAPAILELVRAAEVAEQTLRNGGIFPIKGITWKALNSALAKLNGGKG